ncbi:hypothetical protein PILCRDRAFT_84563 [Piloderma croceum F 1598]|uniref:Uncharacterized protein n=1 Tax=Piloderma croceum (strain F 1598) TaxID=765440 RepID=A0A0C3GCW6_PILCF|nr:hypothetical protein PILCRDRAFT_84563 [Piloderma croceum F 1598]
MAEVWYIGPLGKLAGTLYGADLGFERSGLPADKIDASAQGWFMTFRSTTIVIYSPFVLPSLISAFMRFRLLITTPYFGTSYGFSNSLSLVVGICVLNNMRLDF